MIAWVAWWRCAACVSDVPRICTSLHRSSPCTTTLHYTIVQLHYTIIQLHYTIGQLHYCQLLMTGQMAPPSAVARTQHPNVDKHPLSIRAKIQKLGTHVESMKLQ